MPSTCANLAQEPGHHFLALCALVIGHLAVEEFYAGKFLDDVAKPLAAAFGGETFVRSVEDHDTAVAVHRLEQVTAGLARQRDVVGADIADDAGIDERLVGVDQRDLRGIDLFHRTVGFRELDRHEDDGVRLVLDGVVDQLVLLGHAVRRRRHVIDQLHAEVLGGDRGAGAQRGKDRTLVFGEDRDGLAVRARLPADAERKQQCDTGSRTIHRSLPISRPGRNVDGRARSMGFCFRPN